MGCLILDSQVCRKPESIEGSLLPHIFIPESSFARARGGDMNSRVREILVYRNVMWLAGKGSKRDLCTCHEGKDKKSLADHHMSL
jgi:hypothetical protein